MSKKKALFLYLGTENLGIESLSGYLKSKGHQVELLMDPALFSGSVLYNNRILSNIFDSETEKKLIRAIRKSAPSLIGFSVFTGNYKWALKWAKICKEIFPLVPVVFGGIHATSVPEEVIRHDFVDAVVVGDGEEALEEMLIASGNKRMPLDIKNSVVKTEGMVIRNPLRPYTRGLDTYPFLDKQLFYDKIPGLEECYLTITSRGCPFRCTYCANSALHDVYNFELNHVRKRSVDNVLEELKAVKKRGRAKKIFFGDDVFIFDKKWLEEFSLKYKKEIGLPFWCTAHPAFIDEKIVRLLKDSGCWLVTMGVQSGSPRVRREVFKRSESNEMIARASRLIKESGIILGLDNIFGAPTENEEDLMRGLDLYQEIKPDRIHTFWLTYMPRVEILDKALLEGEITLEEIEKLKQGDMGQFDFGGSVKSNIRMYLKYEFLFHLLSLAGYSQGLKNFFLRRRYLVPASSFINKLLVALNAVKNKDTKFFYLIRSFFFRRYVP